MIEPLAEKLSKEFSIQEKDRLQEALGEGLYAILGAESWKHVDSGTDFLGRSQKHLNLAYQSLKLAHHFLSGEREFLRMSELDQSIIDDLEEIPDIAKKIEKISKLAGLAHRREPRGRKKLDQGLISAFQILSNFWENERGSPPKEYFKENDNYGRTEPGNDGVRFISSALKGLNSEVTDSHIRTLFQKYCTAKISQ